MSLQSSLPLSINQINDELGRATNATTGLAEVDARWLADVPSGPISMSNFLNKRSVKIVHQAGPTALGTSHTFSGVNFGPYFSNRRIHALLYLMNKSSNVTSGWAINGLTIGGDSHGNFVPAWWQGGDGSTQLVGFGASAPHAPLGTSGTISFNSAQNTQVYLIVISASNSLPVHHATGASTGSATSLGITLTVPSNGFVMVTAIRAATNGITLNGVQAQPINQSVAGYQIALGYSNRLSAQSLGANFVSTGAVMGLISGSTRIQGWV